MRIHIFDKHPYIFFMKIWFGEIIWGWSENMYENICGHIYHKYQDMHIYMYLYVV